MPSMAMMIVFRQKSLQTGSQPILGCFLAKGKALDIAAGEGRNSIFAASLGYEVVCMDISEVALSKARALASKNNVKITTVSVDLDNNSLPENEYDLVLCFNFLERNLFPEIHNTLKNRRYFVLRNIYSGLLEVQQF